MNAQSFLSDINIKSLYKDVVLRPPIDSVVLNAAFSDEADDKVLGCLPNGAVVSIYRLEEEQSASTAEAEFTHQFAAALAEYFASDGKNGQAICQTVVYPFFSWHLGTSVVSNPESITGIEQTQSLNRRFADTPRCMSKNQAQSAYKQALLLQSTPTGTETLSQMIERLFEEYYPDATVEIVGLKRCSWVAFKSKVTSFLVALLERCSDVVAVYRQQPEDVIRAIILGFFNPHEITCYFLDTQEGIARRIDDSGCAVRIQEVLQRSSDLGLSKITMVQWIQIVLDIAMLIANHPSLQEIASSCSFLRHRDHPTKPLTFKGIPLVDGVLPSYLDVLIRTLEQDISFDIMNRIHCDPEIMMAFITSLHRLSAMPANIKTLFNVRHDLFTRFLLAADSLHEIFEKPFAKCLDFLLKHSHVRYLCCHQRSFEEVDSYLSKLSVFIDNIKTKLLSSEAPKTTAIDQAGLMKANADSILSLMHTFLDFLKCNEAYVEQSTTAFVEIISCAVRLHSCGNLKLSFTLPCFETLVQECLLTFKFSDSKDKKLAVIKDYVAFFETSAEAFFDELNETERSLKMLYVADHLSPEMQENLLATDFLEFFRNCSYSGISFTNSLDGIYKSCLLLFDGLRIATILALFRWSTASSDKLTTSSTDKSPSITSL